MIHKITIILANLISAPAHSQDFGLWKEIRIPVAVPNWTMIDFIDPAHGVLFSDSGYFAITSNGGETWQRDSIHVLGKVASVRYLNQNTCWITNGVGADRRDIPLMCYLTTNAGNSWTERTIPDSLWSSRWEELTFADTRTLYAVGLRLYKSTDAGISWVSLKPSWHYFPTSVYFTDSLHGSATGFGGGPPFSGGFLQTTFDGGKTWDSTYGGDHYFVHYFTPRLGYAIGAIEQDEFSFPYFQLTSDSGKSWTSTNGVLLAGVKYGSGNILAFTNSTKLSQRPDSLFSIVDDNMGQISQRITAFETISERHAWLLTSEGRLFKRTDTETGIKHLGAVSVGQVELHLSNYPNSFSNTTTIRYGIPSPSTVVLEIFDILGRSVSRLMQQYQARGIYEISWNPNGLANGIYFCRLKSGLSIKTIRVLYYR